MTVVKWLLQNSKALGRKKGQAKVVNSKIAVKSLSNEHSGFPHQLDKATS